MEGYLRLILLISALLSVLNMQTPMVLTDAVLGSEVSKAISPKYYPSSIKSIGISSLKSESGIKFTEVLDFTGKGFSF